MAGFPAASPSPRRSPKSTMLPGRTTSWSTAPTPATSSQRWPSRGAGANASRRSATTPRPRATTRSTRPPTWTTATPRCSPRRTPSLSRCCRGCRSSVAAAAPMPATSPRSGASTPPSREGRVMTGTGQLLAVLLALAGSACYAVAAVTQQGAAAHLAAGRAFDPVVLARLGRRPAWLAGLAAVIAGFALQAAALGLGRLVVIEPVLASGLLFALVLAARRDRRPLRRAEWAAALAVFAGLAVFLAAGQPTGGQRTAGVAVLGVAAGVAAGLTGLSVILAGRFAGPRRALLFGVGGGVAAGATDALVKTVAVLAAGHLLAP